MTRWPNSTGSEVEFNYKINPEDFVVTELSNASLDNRPLHCYLWLQKRDRTTIDVVRQLAQAAQQPESSIGYAGMKDRVAITRQWLSIPIEALGAIQAEVEQDASLELLASAAHGRKLRRGELSGNRFIVVLYNASGVTDAQLASLARTGAPNYFGTQRFGHNQLNIARAERWLEQRQTARGRGRQTKSFTRGLHLSVLRSYLFNEVLAARIGDNSWSQIIDGDLCVGANATGPLWGRGRSTTAGRAAQIEQQALAPHKALSDGLEFAGVQQGRRALVLRAEQLRWHRAQDCLTLRFDLRSGSYATSLLAELGLAQVGGQTVGEQGVGSDAADADEAVNANRASLDLAN